MHPRSDVQIRIDHIRDDIRIKSIELKMNKLSYYKSCMFLQCQLKKEINTLKGILCLLESSVTPTTE